MIREHTAKDGTRSYGVRVGGKSQRTFSEREYGSRKLAKAAARAHEAKLIAGEAGRPNVQVRDYSARVLDHLEREPLKDGRLRKDSTMDTLRASAKPFVAQFGVRYIGQVTRGEARDWALAANRNAVKFAIQFYGRALDEGLVSANPFKGLEPAARGRKADHPPTLEEFARLQKACSVLGDYGPHFRAFLTFAGFSGLRPGELYPLEWDDIDFDGMRIAVNRRLYKGALDLPKSNEPRTAVLIPQARDALLTLDRVAPTVFVSKKGKRLSQATLSGYWQQVKIEAKLDFDFYHATKHRFVHEAFVVKRLSTNAIAQQMGWSRSAVEEMLRTYGHGDFGWQEEWERAYGDNVVEVDFAHASHTKGQNPRG